VACGLFVCLQRIINNTRCYLLHHERGARSANPNTPMLIADLHLPISRGGMDPSQLPMTAAYGVIVGDGLGWRGACDGPSLTEVSFNAVRSKGPHLLTSIRACQRFEVHRSSFTCELYLALSVRASRQQNRNSHFVRFLCRPCPRDLRT
jgi:hypothetical protein